MHEDYLKLLEDQKKLKSKGTSLLAENKQDYIKLLDYERSIRNHFQWEQKDRYFLLITNFLDKKIDIDQYISQLFQLQYGTQDLVEELKLDFEKLKEFQPNPNPVLKGFSELIEYLCSECGACETDPDLRDEYEISETELIDSLRKTFVKLQEYQ